MGVRATWLADAARLTGYPVLEINGWRDRGHGDFRLLEGVVLHHTADGPTGNYPSLGVVRDGRAGLAGPLANLGLGRDGTILVIAAGVGWHAGASYWAGFYDLNDEAIGIEAESRGSVDDWTPPQRDCYPRLAAALCYYLRRGSDRVCGHKECATPAGRKIDPAFWDLGAMRRQVGWYLADPLKRIPRFASPTPAPTTEEDDLTPDQARKLDAIFTQLCEGERTPPADKWGWGTWKGGTDEKLTLIDFLRRNNVEVRAIHGNLASVHAKLDQITGKVGEVAGRAAPEPAAVDPAPIVAAIVEAIADTGLAQQVVDALAARLAKPAA